MGSSPPAHQTLIRLWKIIRQEQSSGAACKAA